LLGLPAEWIRESVGRGNNRGERRDCGQARVGPILHPILATPFSSFSRFWAKSADSGAKIGNLNKALVGLSATQVCVGPYSDVATPALRVCLVREIF
jgi:hypothetical protein